MIVCVACAPTPKETATPTGAVRAKESISIRGVVRDRQSGEPLTFALVVARPLDADRPRDNVASNTATDHEGRFAFAGLRPGTYRLTAQNGALRSIPVDILVGPGPTREIGLIVAVRTDDEPAEEYAAPALPGADQRPADRARTARRGAIRGHIVDQTTGEALAGTVIAATSPSLSDTAIAVANDDGSYDLRGLPPGSYTLSIYYRLVDFGSIELRKSNVHVGPGAEITIPIELDVRGDRKD